MSFYRAVVTKKDEQGNCFQELATNNVNELIRNDIIIKVKYAALNYFDTTAMQSMPAGAGESFVSGIDAAGIVLSSKSTDFIEGDEVVVTGFDMGRSVAGSHGEVISVPADWVLPVPPGLNMRSCMILGSAGLSAAFAVMDLEHIGALRAKSNIAVTGALYDIGSIASAILAKIGCNVVAYVEDRGESADYLKRLGVNTVLPLSDLLDNNSKNHVERYDAAIDTMGGDSITALLNNMKRYSAIIATNDRVGKPLTTSLSPFLDWGVNVIGVDSIHNSLDMKRKGWIKLSSDWLLPQLDWLCTEISINDVSTYTKNVRNGTVKGSVVINYNT